MIDEADRMMEEIKQDWLAQVENAVFNQQDDKHGMLHSKLNRPLPGPNTAAKYVLVVCSLAVVSIKATHHYTCSYCFVSILGFTISFYFTFGLHGLDSYSI